MGQKIFRGIFTLLGLAFGVGLFRLSKMLMVANGIKGGKPLAMWEQVGAAFIIAIIFGIIFFRLYPFFVRAMKKLRGGIDKEISQISTGKLLLGTLGLILGLIVAFLISPIYRFINVLYVGTALTVLTYITLGYLGIFFTVQRGGDIVTIFTGNIHKGAVRRQKLPINRPKILDTSVIIDGRIEDILVSGFLEGPIIIPDFVLLELQHIADSSDSLKRVRGRRGLDILKKIQTEFGIEIYDSKKDKALEEIPEVDIKLLKLGKIMSGKVMTNDFNLNKVAKIEGVEVLNVNELANVLKPVVLPGEKMKLLLVKEGKEREQALAYLDDGTMIVVEDGKKFIGKTIDAEVTTVLQTSAGRMIFGKPYKG